MSPPKDTKELKVVFKNPQNRLRLRLKTVDSTADVTVTTSPDALLPPQIRISENLTTEGAHKLEPMNIDDVLNMAIEKEKLQNANGLGLNLSEDIFAERRFILGLLTRVRTQSLQYWSPLKKKVAVRG